MIADQEKEIKITTNKRNRSESNNNKRLNENTKIKTEKQTDNEDCNKAFKFIFSGI